MCSEYNIKASAKDIESALGSVVRHLAHESEWDTAVKMSVSAPVIRKSENGYEITERVFPVSPFPNSRLSGFENQSDSGNEKELDEDGKQIRRIYDKPRWKGTFARSPYLVPMTSFTEYAYWGHQAGSALAFEIPNEKIFFAAGISIQPFIPKTGKENGFSILTHTATEQMLAYHQRLVVLLRAKEALEYLEEMEPEQRFGFLIENRYRDELSVKKIRNMAKGWEKRIPVQVGKLKREEEYRKVIEAEGVPG